MVALNSKAEDAGHIASTEDGFPAEGDDVLFRGFQLR
jgi:hypothetical protein